VITYGGREWTASDLRRRVGTMAQLAGCETLSSLDGQGRRIRLWASPLAATILPDRGMDLGAVWYRGMPLAWLSPTGFWPQGGVRDDWFSAFGGGFMTTCGLENVGRACEDEGVSYPQHGSIGSLPAEWTRCDAGFEDGRYRVRVEGAVRQARVFGHNLVLHRVYTAWLGEGRLEVEDRLTNEGYAPAPYVILYHVNLGFPLVDDGTRLAFPPGPVIPRDGDAELGLAAVERVDAPVPGMREQVFLRTPTGDRAVVRVENPRLGLGLDIAYVPNELPKLWQWRMLAEGTYVIGIEPSNTTVLGRAVHRATEGLPTLAPGESRSFHLAFRVEALG
jgi:galactose mutarotase-like enzyme